MITSYLLSQNLVPGKFGNDEIKCFITALALFLSTPS